MNIPGNALDSRGRIRGDGEGCAQAAEGRSPPRTGRPMRPIRFVLCNFGGDSGDSARLRAGIAALPHRIEVAAAIGRSAERRQMGLCGNLLA